MPSIRKLLPFFLCLVLGLAVGWASVKWGGSGGSGADQASAGEVRFSSSRHRDGRAALCASTTEELLAIVRRGLAKKDEAAKNELTSGWTDSEILAALDEAVKDPSALLNFNSVAWALVIEYAKRDREAALAWALELPTIQRRKFVGAIVSAWPPERVDEALAFVKKHPDIFGRNVPMSLVSSAVTASAKDGPEAVLARLKELSAQGFNRNVTFPKDIPAGFDYGSLLGSPDFKALGLEMMRSNMIQQWLDQDREAAYQWMTAQDKRPDAMFQLKPRAWETTPEKSVELTRWMAGKVEAFSPEQQIQFAKSSTPYLAQDDGNALVWIASAKSPALQEALRTAAAKAVFYEPENYVDRGLQALATLPDEESRVRALETMLSSREDSDHMPGPSEEAEKLLRTRLAEWGAAQERIDVILKAMKPQKLIISDP